MKVVDTKLVQNEDTYEIYVWVELPDDIDNFKPMLAKRCVGSTHVVKIIASTDDSIDEIMKRVRNALTNTANEYRTQRNKFITLRNELKALEGHEF